MEDKQYSRSCLFFNFAQETLLEALSTSDFLICYVSSPQPHNHPASSPVSLGLPITQPFTLSQRCYQPETSLEVQWLKFHTSTAWELGELRSCLPHGKAKKNYFLFFNLKKMLSAPSQLYFRNNMWSLHLHSWIPTIVSTPTAGLPLAYSSVPPLKP